MPDTETQPLGRIELGTSDAESDQRLADAFVDTGFVRAATQGRRTIVLGPKGSGKSAIFRRLPGRMAAGGDVDLIAVPLTPDDFSWHALQGYREDGVSPEAAHRHAWMYTIVHHVAARVAAEAPVSGRWRGPVAKLRRHLAREMRQAGQTDLSVSVSALGVGVALDRRVDPDRGPLVTATKQTLELLEACLQAVKVVVLLDRLDEQWDGEPEAASLLVGLLMAAKHLNDSLPLERDHGLRVFVFLRSDIYEVLRFDDKDKYRSLEQHLVWDRGTLDELVARRLPEGCTVQSLLGMDARAGWDAWERLIEHTFRRPRDVLQLLGLALDLSDPSASHIPKATLSRAIAQFSHWKVADLTQELRLRDPDLRAALDALRNGPSWFGSCHELEVRLSRGAPGSVERAGARGLVEQLFDASVIGFSSRTSKVRYRCDDPDLVLPANCRIYIHPALASSLNIAERRRPADTDEYWLAEEIYGDTVLLTVGGDLDLYVTPQLRAGLDAVISAGFRHLVLDLSDVVFLDSAVGSVLHDALVRVREVDGTMSFVGPLHLGVERILRITGMTAVIPLYPTRRSALDAAAEASQLHPEE